MPEVMVSRILRLPGYGVYACAADETVGTLTLWVRQTVAEPYYVCGGCGISVRDVHSWTERRLRDLPWGEWQVWLVVEVHRVRCRRCGVRSEQLPFVTGKVHYTTRLEAAVARACEAAPVIRVAAAWHLPPETVRRMDKRVLRRWAAERPAKPLHYLGVDEIYLGRRDKFLTVVSDLESSEPLWADRDRKRETLDRFFAEALPPVRRRAVRAVCVDMWEPFTQSLRAHLPHARIVYDKFHVLRHGNDALDETRRAEFFRLGGAARALLRGKRWLLLRAWGNLERGERQELKELLRRRGVALSDDLGPGAALATAPGLRQSRPTPQPSPRRHPCLLSCQGPVREGRGDQRQHPRDDPPWAGISRPRVPASQSSEGHRRASTAPAHRMNIEPITDSVREREIQAPAADHAEHPCS